MPDNCHPHLRREGGEQGGEHVEYSKRDTNVLEKRRRKWQEKEPSRSSGETCLCDRVFSSALSGCVLWRYPVR